MRKSSGHVPANKVSRGRAIAQAPEATNDADRTRPRRTVKVAEVVAGELLEYVLSGDLTPGTKLPPEAEMLSTYSVGRGSLREALRILEVYGLISIRPGPGGGPVVEAVGPREMARLLMFYLNIKGVSFADLLRSSRMLQGMMAAEAARLRNPDQIKLMQDCLDRAAETDHEVEYGQAISKFHSLLFDAPGGELLGLLHDALHQIIALRIRRKISLPEARQSLGEHQAILDAIVDGDAERASFLATDHAAKVDRRYERAVPGLLEETITWA